VNIIIALAAFAATMVVLSTVVTVIVEFAHKALLLRLAGLKEMLRALHDGPLQQLGPDPFVRHPGMRATQSAVQFSNQMTRTPSSNRRSWYFRSWPLLSRFMQTEFDRLTTLQFVEQLAQTDQGRRLGQLDVGSMRAELTRLAYQFERYGEAQLDYFRRRAKTLSVVVAIAFAAFANVDAFALFSFYARDQAQANRIINAVESAEATLRSSSEQAATAAAQITSAEAAERAALTSMTQQSAALGAWGLPIGEVMFPLCSAGPSPDPRCAARTGHLTVLTRPDRLRVDFSNPPAQWIDTSRAMVAVPSAPNWMTLALTSPHTSVWLLGVLLAGGLMGLGAPFWFDMFRTFAMAASPWRTRAPPQGGEAVSQRDIRYGSVSRRARTSDPDDLVRGFLISSGIAPHDGAQPLPGARVASSSSELIS